MAAAHIPIFLAALLAASACATALAPAGEVTQNSDKPIQPLHVSTRGDYQIEQYSVRKGELLKIRTRGTYVVSEIAERELVLQPSPPHQKGLLDSPWRIPVGRSPIGNHHQVMVTKLDTMNGTASLSLEFKVKWHFWDINF